jgi:hypothetical protein
MNEHDAHPLEVAEAFLDLTTTAKIHDPSAT